MPGSRFEAMLLKRYPIVPVLNWCLAEPFATAIFVRARVIGDPERNRARSRESNRHFTRRALKSWKERRSPHRAKIGAERSICRIMWWAEDRFGQGIMNCPQCNTQVT